ncbi:MAG: Gfo/Idh/MocA family oxidoreductase [Candidatus Omnitrophica bacterium]|nr:Gfo/Idh/MocA family oxidoreductase [Candidatus Omnitrophota bacterium]MCM8802859.1 Gfo/Idh/MocA family oxidoreductase [Candidatus Omnitrophota bacterium]
MIKVGIVGTGDRGTSFVKAIERIPEMKVVAVVDINPIRMEAVIKHHNYPPVEKFFSIDEFLKAKLVDIVFITTPDWTHSELIIRCLKEGYNVFCDKPLAINEEQITEILKVSRQTNKMMFMGFNMRYKTLFRKMKEIAINGEIGKILVGWSYSGYSGDGYFRRWHKFREKSGGLIVHKGCHTIDILNWIVDSYPVEVYAIGGLNVFGGDKRWEGCHKCEETDTCPYARRLSEKDEGLLEDIYIKAAAIDGYTRNYCVFGPTNVYDNYLVEITYANGSKVSFTEIFFGTGLFFLGFAGDKGEILTDSFIKNTIILRKKIDSDIKEEIYKIESETKEFHGGADINMLQDMIESLNTGKQILPGFVEGARAAIIGIAAMHSIDTKKPIKISDLIPIELIV